MSFTIRPATIADAAVLAHIHVEGWRAAYDGQVDPDFLVQLSVSERESDWKRWFADSGMHVLLAEDTGGVPCGLISFGKLRTPIPGASPIRPPYSAEIYAFYILPAYWRQGLGKELLQAAVQALRPLKHRSLSLWVLEKNARAVAFYKTMGGERCGKKDIEIGKSKVRDICFGWRDTKIIAPEI